METEEERAARSLAELRKEEMAAVRRVIEAEEAAAKAGAELDAAKEGLERIRRAIAGFAFFSRHPGAA